MKGKKIGVYAKRPLYMLELNRKSLIRLTVFLCESLLAAAVFKGSVAKISHWQPACGLIGMVSLTMLFVVLFASFSRQSKWGKGYLAFNFLLLAGSLCCSILL